MSLAAMAPGARARIRGIRCCGPLSCRLMEFGLIEGTEVELVRRAPLGDPLQIRLGDFDLSLRSSEAALIDVDAL